MRDDIAAFDNSSLIYPPYLESLDATILLRSSRAGMHNRSKSTRARNQNDISAIRILVASCVNDRLFHAYLKTDSMVLSITLHSWLSVYVSALPKIVWGDLYDICRTLN